MTASTAKKPAANKRSASKKQAKPAPKKRAPTHAELHETYKSAVTEFARRVDGFNGKTPEEQAALIPELAQLFAQAALLRTYAKPAAKRPPPKK